jgi:hypothetical protein
VGISQQWLKRGPSSHASNPQQCAAGWHNQRMPVDGTTKSCPTSMQSINQSINVTPVAMKLKKLMPAIH